MATHSSIPAWRIPWTEEPGGLQSKELQRVGHDWAQTQRWETSHLRRRSDLRLDSTLAFIAAVKGITFSLLTFGAFSMESLVFHAIWNHYRIIGRDQQIIQFSSLILSGLSLQPAPFWASFQLPIRSCLPHSCLCVHICLRVSSCPHMTATSLLLS